MSYLSLLAMLVFLIAIYLSLSTFPFHRPTTAIGRKKVTGDELSARTKENGYQRGAHRDKDSRRD
jgi:hypothetical protein